MPRRLAATLRLTSCPCAQYTTTGWPFGVSALHSATESGGRRIAPAIIHSSSSKAGRRRTSIRTGAAAVPMRL